MFDNEFGSYFRLSSTKPFIFNAFSHFYHQIHKIQNPRKALFYRLFHEREIIPTRQIQIYGGVFEVVLQEKLSQIC